MNYLHNQITQPIPQTEPLDERQIQNEAGGYVYDAGPWQQLDRFLLIGSEGGTFYVNERKSTFENIKVVNECLESDGARVLKRVLDFSVTGRAHKQDQLLYTLARAFCYDSTKKEAERIFTQVVRTGYHLFLFISYLKTMRGFGRAMRRTIAKWYTEKNENDLSYQLLKYQSRNGWTHRDVLRLCHAPDNRASIRWALGLPLEERVVQRALKSDQAFSAFTTSYPAVGELPSRLASYEALCQADSEAEVIRLILNERFTHEMVPNQWKKSENVWMALLEDMPLGAAIRNLGKMSAVGLLKPFSDSIETLVIKLSEEAIERSRIHPMAILLAAHTYRAGHGMRGSLSWTPNNQVRELLEDAFYKSFENVRPTGKNLMIGIDVSGSMTTPYGSTEVQMSTVAAAVALITARTEERIYCVGFSDKVTELYLSKNDTLSSVLEKMDKLSKWGGTDCAAPIEFASKSKIPNIDAFVSYTDNQTWAGRVHPKTALEKYRKKYNGDVLNIIVGMEANKFSVADPQDARSLDIAGFDAAVPALISEFISGF